MFRGRILDVREDTVRYADGSRGTLEIVHHRGAAAALPMYRSGEWTGGTGAAIVLLRQYRYAARQTLWEVPAGKLEEGESPEACARRELEEEAGLRAERLVRLTALLTSPGFSDEVIHLFVATGLSEGPSAPEAHEQLSCHALPLRRAVEGVRRGEIVDGKTVCAILWAAAFPDAWGEAPPPGGSNDPGGGGV